MVPLHAQPCAGAPDRLRWVTPAVLPFTGPVSAVPAPLAALLADGTLAEVMVEPAAVLTRLGAGHSWRDEGARVRTALQAALAEPLGWAPAGPSSTADAVLFGVAREVIATIVDPYARSHGGGIELVGVADGEVTVRLRGACHGCPAARVTLQQRLERELRRRYPPLRGVLDTG